MKYFAQIILQAKDETCDWRGFVLCRDSDGVRWELRGLAGKTPEEAAKNAWERYNDDEVHWDIYGIPFHEDVEAWNKYQEYLEATMLCDGIELPPIPIDFKTWRSTFEK